MALFGARTTLPLRVLGTRSRSRSGTWPKSLLRGKHAFSLAGPLFTARHVAGGSVLALDGEPPGQRSGPAGVKGVRASTGEGERRGGRGSPRSGRVRGAFGEERWSGSRDAG